jgi:hypothetical protein
MHRQHPVHRQRRAEVDGLTITAHCQAVELIAAVSEIGSGFPVILEHIKSSRALRAVRKSVHATPLQRDQTALSGDTKGRQEDNANSSPLTYLANKGERSNGAATVTDSPPSKQTPVCQSYQPHGGKYRVRTRAPGCGRLLRTNPLPNTHSPPRQ